MHKLAWTLDACLKDCVIDGRRLRELTHFMSTFDRQQAALAAAGACGVCFWSADSSSKRQCQRAHEESCFPKTNPDQLCRIECLSHSCWTPMRHFGTLNPLNLVMLNMSIVPGQAHLDP